MSAKRWGLVQRYLAVDTMLWRGIPNSQLLRTPIICSVLVWLAYACGWIDWVPLVVCGCVRILVWCDLFGGLRRWRIKGGEVYI